MLDNHGFDLWADGYDHTVDLSDDDNSYPFAGYKRVLATIYDAIRAGQGKRVLDIGFGTGVLSAKLYRDGYEITGIDFSTRMIELAKEKMPGALLIRHDFSKGLPEALKNSIFDAIVCTYAIHHLDDAAKIGFLKELRGHLTRGGRIFIGDVAFATRKELEACRDQYGDEWDDEEFYVAAEEIAAGIDDAQFQKMSHCAGILTIGNMKIQIIPMVTDADKDGKGYVHWKSWHETYTDLVDASYNAIMTQEKCHEIAHKWWQNHLVAKDGDRVIGYVGWQETDGCFLINGLYVLADYHRQQVGYRLMNAALAQLPEDRRIILWVLKGNERGIRFYERYGFRFDGTEEEIMLGTPRTQLRMVYTK